MRKYLFILSALAAMAGGAVIERRLHSAVDQPVDLNVAFPDMEGKPHLLSEWRGKVLVINFWASWCPPCVEEMPEFVRLQTELSSKGVVFIGILSADETSAAKAFLKDRPVNYPILDGSIGGSAWSAKLGNSTDVLPVSLVIDAQGNIVHRELGLFSREEVLEQINAALR